MAGEGASFQRLPWGLFQLES